ncbi:MAG: hypothetical protein ACFE88_08245 [Candidatus Hermodarchaeota archaeon]
MALGKLQTPEELAQEALKFLEFAQNFEEKKDLESAISNYQKAADLLKQSGFLMHRIQEIYDRIGELKDFIEKDALYQRVESQAQIEQLQDQAFNLLEGAKKLEFDGFFEDATQQNLSAINLLAQAGWTETQLEHIKSKINQLSRALKQQKSIQQSQDQDVVLKKQVPTVLPDEKSQVVGMFGKKSSVEKAEVLEKIQRQKKYEEDIQNQAFTHIDAAKMFEKDNKFDNAILNYERAIELLESIGWEAQTQNIQIIIEKLKKDKMYYDSLQARQKQEALKLTGDIEEQKIVLQKEVELKKEKLNELEAKKLHDEKIQMKAFNLIDIGNRLEREKKYDLAIEKLKEAVQLLNSIEWDSYVKPIISLIDSIKNKQKRELAAEHLKEKRQKDLMNLQDSILKKQKEQVLQSAKELDTKRKDFEVKRSDEVQREEEFFKVLDKADEILKDKNFDGAIKEYNNALEIILDLGSGWEAYKTMIKNTISNIENLKHTQLTKEYQEQKKIEERRREEINFQNQISLLLSKERDRLKEKVIIVKDTEKEIKFLEQRKNVAFELLDSAIDFLNEGKYEDTILAYQKAANVFAEIQWTEEIPLIEDSIREVEELQKQQEIQKQKKLQHAIERQRKEEDFQKQILRYLQQERENLKRKEIELKEREKETQYHEERRKSGFKLLEQAQEKVKLNNFDEAIEILKYAITFFAETEWQNEITLIQNSIVEIENRKREAELQKQIKLQSELERERREKTFQELITKEMKTQREKFMEREIIIRETEKELAYREEKKKQAFDLLDKAQDFISHRKFDDALELYYDVVNIFAQIQWIGEISVIQEAINDIENKKREDELNKQKSLQRTIKKEAEDKAFIDLIKYQREREKADFLIERELKEKQKSLSAQNIVKQKEGFKLIEEGEILLEAENFNDAINNYNKAIEILKEIGWGEGYLKLLHDTIETIELKKKERQKEKQIEFESLLKRQKEEDLFQKGISENMEIEQERLKIKEIQLQKREDLVKLMEKSKLEAFKIMDEAQNLLNKGEYDKSIEKYHQAELLLNEINFPTTAIKEMIQKVQEKKKEEDLNKFKELEIKSKREQEELLFQQQVIEKMKLEQYKMKEKQAELLKQEELKVIHEQKKEEAFNKLEEAQKKIELGKFDDAIELYRFATQIFKEIEWESEIELIQNSINTIENKKREVELKKQHELNTALEKEKEEHLFQQRISEEMKIQREELKKREIKLREIEKEISYRENKKADAFKLLEKAQDLLSNGEFDDAIEVYHDVANIFAQIQWIDEISVIQEAINEIENKKRKDELNKQKSIQDALEMEKANIIFMEKVNDLRKIEQEKALDQKSMIQMREIITAQNLATQQEAFTLLNNGYSLLSQEKYDNAVQNYENAIKLLTEIGWTSDYLKLLQDTVKTIENRKREIENRKELEIELSKKRQEEELQFQRKISESMQREQKRLKAKQIEMQKREQLIQTMEKRKAEAFNLMDKGEEYFNKQQYPQAIEKYRQAELFLNEIGFPTNAIREMIHKIREKNKEKVFAKQRSLETQLQEEKEEIKFQRKITEIIRINEMKAKVKEAEFEKRREMRAYMEKRKEEAFNLLEDAEIFLKKSQYDKSLEYYHAAELILNEIAFPTDSIRELILKVQEKKREHELQKQKDLELLLQKEREEWKFQRKVAENLEIEKKRLKSKELRVLKKEELKLKLEKRKEQAFKILDEGELFLKEKKYDNALVCYRKAGIILNELQFPTDSINNTIFKIKKLSNQKIEEEKLKYQKELERFEEEKALEALIEERKRQEREKREAQQLALKERERLIQEQMNVRESAYSLLEEAGKYLKHRIPNYNEAISLYIQAKHILEENIGWEPEINNLNALIKDLQQEQSNYLEKKRLEEQAQLQRQNELALFQDEVKKRRLEQEKLKGEQEKQYRNLILKRQQIDKLRDDGLKLIDEGKKWSAYHNFEKAYQNFNSAISKFKEIGWEEEVKYIETEIKNTKILEERVKKEELRIQSIQKQLEEQRALEKERRKAEELKLKDTISEVSELTDEVLNLIEKRRQEQKLSENKKKEKLEYEAKEFRKEMGELIKIKQELTEEIRKKEKEKSKFEEELQKAKQREEIDNLKRMIKEKTKKKRS